MWVKLKRNWFTPKGRFRAGRYPVEVPDELRDILPPDALVVKTKEVVEEEESHDTFSEHNKLYEQDATRAELEATEKAALTQKKREESLARAREVRKQKRENDE